MDPLIKSQRLRTSASLHSEHSFSGEANGHRAALLSETSFWVNAPSENIAGSRIRTRPLHGRYIGAVPTPQISANLGLLLVGVAGFEATRASHWIYWKNLIQRPDLCTLVVYSSQDHFNPQERSLWITRGEYERAASPCLSQRRGLQRRCHLPVRGNSQPITLWYGSRRLA